MKLVQSPTERSTAATDILLARVGIGGAAFLHGASTAAGLKAAVWAWVFGLVAFSGALGALAHGLELPPRVHATLWQGIRLGLGLAVSLFVVGVVVDLAGPESARRMVPPMLAAGAGCCLAAGFFPGRFIVFVLYQAAASVFALGAYAYLAAFEGLAGAGIVALGVLLSLAAAFVQTRRRWRLRLVWEFDHNGLFHLVQAAGMLAILAGLGASL